MIRIRLTQLDGKLPNLALMKLAHWHRAQGHEVIFTRRANRQIDLLSGDPTAGFDTEGRYDAVYASAIFEHTAPALQRFRRDWPTATIGGTASGNTTTVEDIIGHDYEFYDYADTPPVYTASLGFTSRGCRLACKFCVVPDKEGPARAVNTIADIWRGPGHPKKIHLLDNDFFGQPPHAWEARLREIQDHNYQVCFNQGLNIRKVGVTEAQALASHLIVRTPTSTGTERRRYLYRDDGFTEPRLYTAWDNLKDEEVFFKGVRHLADAGIPPTHLMAYMLMGFDKSETIERLLYRLERMEDLGITPYPMVLNTPRGGIPRRELKRFQRWVIQRHAWKIKSTGNRKVEFADYNANIKTVRIAAKQTRLQCEPLLI